MDFGETGSDGLGVEIHVDDANKTAEISLQATLEEVVTPEEVADWLKHTGHYGLFREKLDAQKDPFTTLAQLREVFGHALDAASAYALTDTFLKYRKKPDLLRAPDGYIGLRYLGAGKSARVLVAKAQTDTLPAANGAVKGVRDDVRESLRILKIFHTSDGPATEMRRRMREGRVMEKLHAKSRQKYGKNLPCISGVHANATDHQSQPHMALSYEPGYSAGQVFETRGAAPLPFRFVCDYAAQAARAMHMVHGLDPKLVHRDIKDDNFKLAEAGKQVRVMILDYGLARHDQATESYNATAPGVVCGTPRYMSPEQARGSVSAEDEGADIDVQSDVFALGARLYEMLTGKTPFVIDRSLVQILKDRAALKQQPSLHIPKGTEPHIEMHDDVGPFFKRIHTEEGKAEHNHFAAVLNFVCRMCHPDREERPTPEEVATFFHRRSTYGGMEFNAFSSIHSYETTGLPIMPPPAPPPAGTIAISSGYESPQEMLDALVRGSEEAAKQEGAYDFIRDLKLGRRDLPSDPQARQTVNMPTPDAKRGATVVQASAPATMVGDEVPTATLVRHVEKPWYKRGRVQLAAAGSAVAFFAVLSAAVMLSRPGEDSKDDKDDDKKTLVKDSGKEKEKEKEKDQEQPKIVLPPPALTFQPGSGLQLVRDGKEVFRIQTNDFFSLVDEDHPEQPPIYTGKILEKEQLIPMMRQLRPNLIENELPKGDKDMVQVTCYLLSHPTEPLHLLYVRNTCAVFLDQTTDGRPQLFMLSELGQQPGPGKVLNALQPVKSFKSMKGLKLTEKSQKSIIDATNKTLKDLKERSNKVGIGIDLDDPALRAMVAQLLFDDRRNFPGTLPVDSVSNALIGVQDTVRQHTMHDLAVLEGRHAIGRSKKEIHGYAHAGKHRA